MRKFHEKPDGNRGGSSDPVTEGEQKNAAFLELLRQKKLEMPPVSEGIDNQILSAVKAIQKLRENSGKEGEDKVREEAMLYFKLRQFVYSRDNRAAEMESPEVKEAKEIKRELFPFGVPKLMLCVDGRVLAKTVAGLHGNSLRTPAGKSVEFLPDQDGNLFLMEGELSAILKEALEEQETVVEGLDSHCHCAAGGLIAKKEHGHDLPDGGLWDDVVYKKKMGQAFENYVTDEYGPDTKKRVIPMQFSFDPHGGWLHMGLEKDDCLAAGKTAGGYTEDVLTQLADEGKIISTEKLLDEDNQFLRKLFTTKYFEINYETDYTRSTQNFWVNIKEMSDEALPFIEEKLKEVFEHLKDKKNEKELKERAVFILANTYNAFLHNFDQVGKVKEYPYKEHSESVIVVTYSERGPFDRAAAFSIDPNEPDLSQAVDLAHGIVQNNRRGGKMSKTEQMALDALYPEEREKYVNNPVPVFTFERLNEIPGKEMLEKLQQANWSDLAEIDWIKMDRKDFSVYLNRKVPNIPEVVAAAMHQLHQRAQKLYEPGQDATRALLDGRLALFSTLAGPNRETIAILPFVTRGYVVGDFRKGGGKKKKK